MGFHYERIGHNTGEDRPRDYKHISVKPISPVIGAEIGGIDLAAPLDDERLSEVHTALMDHCVVFFRDQQMTLEQHKDFGRRFGELHIHPAAKGPEGHPEILVVHADAKSKYVAGGGWHSDVSADEEPPMGSILHIQTVPECGGDTLFANMYAAYEALSETMQRFLDGLTAMHGSEHVYQGGYGVRQEDATRKFPKAEHPVVRTHPVTGRKALFVNEGFTTHIVGMKPAESRALLDMLYEHIKTPEFQCRFNWRPNSVAFWDNRCVQHYAIWDYYPNVRHGNRVTIKGDRPFH